MVKAKNDTTIQLCSCSSLTKRREGSIFQRASLLKFPQCNYCYKFKNKFLKLKYLLLSKIKADEDKFFCLALFSARFTLVIAWF